MKDLFADAAAGKPITEERVREKLAAAQEQMGK
jgi:multiple sugar transport system substrate-binding protein